MTLPTSLMCPPRLAAAAWLLACVALGCGRGAPAPDEEPHPAPVKAEAIRRASLQQWTDLFGNSLPLVGHSAQVSAGVDGRVLAILPDLKGEPVKEGHQVAAGQVIVQLDDRVPRANRAKLEADAKDFEEQKKQADLEAAQARYEVERIEKLRPPGMPENSLPLASQVDLDKARMAFKIAEVKAKAAVARQESAQAGLKALDEQLTYYTLRSPIAGQLGLVRAMPGQYLTVGTTVAEVVSLDKIDVLCYVAPDVAARLQLKQAARLLRHDGSALNEASSPTGEVVFIAVQGQAETGNFGVKVRFPNRDLRMRSNAVVRLQVLTQSKKDALSIPAVALSADQDPPGIILVTEEKNKKGEPLFKARRLQALVGIRDREQNLVEVRGLRDAEANQDVPVRDDMRFVVEGGNGLETGDIVELPKEEHEKEK